MDILLLLLLWGLLLLLLRCCCCCCGYSGGSPIIIIIGLPPRQDISLGKAVPGQGSLGVRGQVRIHLRAFFGSINFIYALTLISLDTNIYVLLPTPPGTGAGFGESPGHPASSRLPAGEPAACRRPRPGFCAYRHGAPRARAVSLLTGRYTLHLPFIQLK